MWNISLFEKILFVKRVPFVVGKKVSRETWLIRNITYAYSHDICHEKKCVLRTKTCFPSKVKTKKSFTGQLFSFNIRPHVSQIQLLLWKMFYCITLLTFQHEISSSNKISTITFLLHFYFCFNYSAQNTQYADKN